MEGLILLALIIIIIPPILSIVALVRSKNNKNNVSMLKQRIDELEQQLQSTAALVKNKNDNKNISLLKQRVDELEQHIQTFSLESTATTIKHEVVTQQVSTVSEEEASKASVFSTIPLPDPAISAINSEEQTGSIPESFVAMAKAEPEQSLEYEIAPLSSIEQAENIAPPANKKPEKHVQPTIPATEEKSAELPGMISSLISWFLRGNPLAKLGVILLFFGLVYLMKHSIEQNMFPIEFRVISAALISFALLTFGWKLRHKQLTYALILQGGAIGALYLTVFGAFKLYDLLPQTLAFGLMIVICAASVGLAVLQGALSLSMLASIGGYLSPILLSTGGGSHVGLFSYYLMISLGILAVSVWQHWRVLNLLGFFFTFGVATAWGVLSYKPDYYLSCQLFLIANILIFGVFSVGLSLRQQTKGKEVIDGILLFGPPLIGFGMQYGITEQWAFGPAFSALGFGVVYLILALASLRRYPILGPKMATSGLALGLAFVTLAIPLALSAQWTSIAWTLEGLGILWVGLTQAQRRMAWGGSAVMVLALISTVITYAEYYQTDFASILVIAVVTAGHLAAGALWYRSRLEGSFQAQISFYFTVAGILIWIHWLWRINELIRDSFSLTQPESMLSISVVLMCLSVVSWRLIGLRLNWIQIRMASWLLWPFVFVTVLSYYKDSGLFSIETQSIWVGCCIFATAIGYWLLKHEGKFIEIKPIEQGLHISLFWLLLLVLIHFAMDVADWSHRTYWGMDEWIIALLNAFIAIIAIATIWLLKRKNTMLTLHRQLYLSIGLTPVIILLLALTFHLNTMDGVMMGWGYIPFFSPLDEAVLFGLLTIGFWLINTPYNNKLFKQYSYALLALCGFLWINVLILRTLSYYGEIRWGIEYLWSSRLVQTTFALLWTLAALICMICSTKYQHRKMWLAGAALLGITIIKLFIVDSARGGGLARAIAFIGVAVLVLIVGYFAPLPPKEGSKINQDVKV